MLIVAAAIDPAAAKPPNFVFIMADDLGYHDLGCYGQKKIATPHLDRLAARGTLFTDVYSGSSVCAPARSVLMTGYHSGRTLIRGNSPVEGGQPDRHGGSLRLSLGKDDVTLAQVLKAAGYRTGMTGKWGLGEEASAGEPNRKGFDEWFGYLNQRHAHSYYPEFQWHNGERVELPGNRNGGREHYSHDLHSEFALDFLSEAAPRPEPFFLYLPYQIPHSNYEIPSLGEYEKRGWSRDAKVHAAMITRLDRDVGRIMERLEELGVAGNTYVFFTSDNGAAQRWDGVFNSSHPFRGRKRDLYEGGIRVPMIVAGPGVPAGARSAAPWYFPDVMPTLAELAGPAAGKAMPADIDGLSVVASLHGESQDALVGRLMYWEFHEGGFQQAARRGHWKAVRRAGKGTELYHLSDDPAEARDLAAEHPEVVAAFEEAFLGARRPSRHWPTALDTAANPG